MSVFDEFRERLAEGKDMTDLQVVLEAARHALVCENNLYCCDRPDGCPHCAECERGGAWKSDLGNEIRLIDAAIERFRPFSGN